MSRKLLIITNPKHKERKKSFKKNLEFKTKKKGKFRNLETFKRKLRIDNLKLML